MALTCGRWLWHVCVGSDIHVYVGVVCGCQPACSWASIWHFVCHITGSGRSAPDEFFLKFQMKIAVVCCCFLYCIVFLHLYGARHKAPNLALTLYAPCVPELLLFVVSCWRSAKRGVDIDGWGWRVQHCRAGPGRRMAEGSEEQWRRRICPNIVCRMSLPEFLNLHQQQSPFRVRLDLWGTYGVEERHVPLAFCSTSSPPAAVKQRCLNCIYYVNDILFTSVRAYCIIL